MTDTAPPTWPGEPTHFAAGFRASAGYLKLNLGYFIYPHGTVLLFVQEQLQTNPPSIWRSFFTTKQSAVKVAEDLCADAQDYIDNVGVPQRPHEDLDFDDYLEHLKARLNNELH